MADAENFKKIIIREGTNKSHIYVPLEESLYRDNGKKVDSCGNPVQYLRCIDDLCLARGQVKNGYFFRTKRPNQNDFPNHNHENHKYKAESEIAYAKLKTLVIEKPSIQINDLYLEIIEG